MVTSMRAEVGGVGTEFDVSGEGRPVLLLHGFPDTGRLWRHQVDALVAAGYRTIVPDLRGYGRSDRPEAVDAYGLATIATDAVAVLDAAGVERAHVVGHDWGAGVAWILATLFPDRVDHLAVLAVGHPRAFADAGFEQREKAWYMLLFQFAGIAETWLSADDWANLRTWAGHPDTDAVIADLEASGSLTPALNYYRANVHPSSLIEPPLDLPPVTAPTMGVWSSGDMALTERQMTDSGRHVTGPWRYERLDGPGHWMQLEQPDAINRLLLDFLPR
jgi:pimeloyl-ACP methyl ester carboxylesterase